MTEHWREMILLHAAKGSLF